MILFDLFDFVCHEDLDQERQRSAQEAEELQQQLSKAAADTWRHVATLCSSDIAYLYILYNSRDPAVARCTATGNQAIIECLLSVYVFYIYIIFIIFVYKYVFTPISKQVYK